MRVRKIARELLKLADAVLYDGNEWHKLNNLEDMKKIARKTSCRVDSKPMKSTVGDSWTFSHGNSGFEIDVSFADDGVWVSVFYGGEQEPLVSYEKMKNINTVNDLARVVKKAIKEAESDPLADHLKYEDSLW